MNIKNSYKSLLTGIVLATSLIGCNDSNMVSGLIHNTPIKYDILDLGGRVRLVLTDTCYSSKSESDPIISFDNFVGVDRYILRGQNLSGSSLKPYENSDSLNSIIDRYFYNNSNN